MSGHASKVGSHSSMRGGSEKRKNGKSGKKANPFATFAVLAFFASPLHSQVCPYADLQTAINTRACAQEPKTAQEKQERPDRRRKPDDESVIAIDTAEVLLPVTVRDSRGQFVTDMKAEDFTIFEEGVPQPISSFALKRMPVHVVIMMDTSSSALKRALNRLRTGMFTKFNDALYLAAREQLGKIKGRKAIIVLTDGIDSGRGSVSAERAFRALIEEETPVYAVSKTRIQSRVDRDELEYFEKASSSSVNKLRIEGIKMALAQLETSERTLTRIAEETGGRIFLPASFADLNDAYQQVADELRSQYVIF